jgi:hypothetical protein
MWRLWRRRAPTRHNQSTCAPNSSTEVRGARGIRLALQEAAMLLREEKVMGTFRKSVVLAVGFVGMLAGSASAQDRLVARIPFPFVVRGATLPAGSYDLVDDQGLITIRGNGAQRKSAAVAMATPTSGQDPEGREPALVFTHSEDGRYTLSQIWESDSKGLALTRHSARERRMSALQPASESPAVVSAEYAK